MVMRSTATEGGSASEYQGERPDQALDAIWEPATSGAIHTFHGLAAIQKISIFKVRSGLIRRIPIK
jgi:hypothetical protein